MSKKALKRGKGGKQYGRAHGALVWNDIVGRKVTPKMDKVINSNRSKSK